MAPPGPAYRKALADSDTPCAPAIPLLLKRLQTRFGLKLAGGQGPLQGKIFRTAQMGLTDELDVVSTLAALELALIKIG